MPGADHPSLLFNPSRSSLHAFIDLVNVSCHESHHSSNTSRHMILITPTIVNNQSEFTIYHPLSIIERLSGRKRNITEEKNGMFIDKGNKERKKKEQTSTSKGIQFTFFRSPWLHRRHFGLTQTLGYSAAGCLRACFRSSLHKSIQDQQ